MKVLFVCSLGMSSEIAVQALYEEAKKNDVELDVKAVSTQEFTDEVKEGYDCALVAPQVRHRFSLFKEAADEANVPCAMIEPMAYTPLGGPRLLRQVNELVEKKEI